MRKLARAVEQPFKVAHAEPRSELGGNGIRVIGWSSSGVKLLFEVNFWTYESDSCCLHVPMIYDASTGTATEVRGFDKALIQHFGSDCEFEAAVNAWKGNDQIVVKISKPPEDESYEQRFCVTKPRFLVYDLQKEAVQPGMAK